MKTLKLTQPKPSTSKTKLVEPENVEESDKYHITAAGRKFLKEQGKFFINLLN